MYSIVLGHVDESIAFVRVAGIVPSPLLSCVVLSNVLRLGFSVSACQPSVLQRLST